MKRKRFIKDCVIVGAVMLLYLCVLAPPRLVRKKPS